MSKQTAASGPTADPPCCPPVTEQRMPAEAAAVLAPAFKALGDPVRLQLLSMIASAPGGEICVCDLTPAFDLTGPTISHHLRTLREAGLVDAERRGTWVYYRARPVLLRRLAALLAVPTAPAGDDPARPGPRAECR
ncbi:metalloregulator ArsR/SmtB family transcription factor [Micromonospora rifamycinica]|uniref:ArsR/SmtB family transcription factor n=1 Tax=Micromonospora rifamycinica TaxID=291594 RepID=UPI00343194D7